jgi:hypothetical protein
MPSAAKVLLLQMNSNSAATASATVSYYSESDGNLTSGSTESHSEMLRVEAELIVDQVVLTSLFLLYDTALVVVHLSNDEHLVIGYFTSHMCIEEQIL